MNWKTWNVEKFHCWSPPSTCWPATWLCYFHPRPLSTRIRLRCLIPGQSSKPLYWDLNKSSWALGVDTTVIELAMWTSIISALVYLWAGLSTSPLCANIFHYSAAMALKYPLPSFANFKATVPCSAVYAQMRDLRVPWHNHRGAGRKYVSHCHQNGITSI